MIDRQALLSIVFTEQHMHTQQPQTHIAIDVEFRTFGQVRFKTVLSLGPGYPNPAAGGTLPPHPHRPQQVRVPGGLHRVPDHPGHRALLAGIASNLRQELGIIYFSTLNRDK